MNTTNQIINTYSSRTILLKKNGYNYDPLVNGWKFMSGNRKIIPDKLVSNLEISFVDFELAVKNFVPLKQRSKFKQYRTENTKKKKESIVTIDKLDRNDALDYRVSGGFGTGKRR